MKRLTVFFICLIVALNGVVSLNAQRGTEILYSNSSKYKDEMNDVRLAVKSALNEYGSYIGNREEDIDFEYMYRCYSFRNSDFVDAYAENENFLCNINENYFWVVPSYSVGGEVDVVSNAQSEFGWSVRGARELRKYKGDRVLDMGSVYDSIIQQYPSADTESFRNLYSEYIHCKLIYFTSEGTEYLYPMFLDEHDPEWAESEKIYTVKAFVENAAPNFDNEIEDDGPISFVQENIDVLVICSILLLAVVISVFIVIKRKKNNKEKEDEV